MTKEELISQITSTISANGNQDITGTKLQEVLVSIVDTLYSAIDGAVIDASPEDFTELILQSLGTRVDATMSQKAITDALTALNYGINAIPVFARIDRVDPTQAPSVVNSSTELPGEIVYVIYEHPYFQEGFYWKASDNNYYTWFADAHLYKVDANTPVRYNKLFECAEDGKQYVIVAGSTTAKPNLVILGTDSGSAVVESNDIPKFNGVIKSVPSIISAVAPTYEGIYFSEGDYTFVAKLGTDYYASWDTSHLYKDGPGVIESRLFEYNKQLYMYDGKALNLLSNAPKIDGYTYISTATPSTAPVTLTGEEKVFYIATEEGDYSKFSLGNISELSIIKSDRGIWKAEGLGMVFDKTIIRTELTQGYYNTNGATAGFVSNTSYRCAIVEVKEGDEVHTNSQWVGTSAVSHAYVDGNNTIIQKLQTKFPTPLYISSELVTSGVRKIVVQFFDKWDSSSYVYINRINKELPMYENLNDKYLKVENGKLQWSALENELPDYSSEEQGKSLTVDEEGNLTWTAISNHENSTEVIEGLLDNRVWVSYTLNDDNTVTVRNIGSQPLYTSVILQVKVGDTFKTNIPLTGNANIRSLLLKSNNEVFKVFYSSFDELEISQEMIDNGVTTLVIAIDETKLNESTYIKRRRRYDINDDKISISLADFIAKSVYSNVNNNPTLIGCNSISGYNTIYYNVKVGDFLKSNTTFIKQSNAVRHFLMTEDYAFVSEISKSTLNNGLLITHELLNGADSAIIGIVYSSSQTEILANVTRSYEPTNVDLPVYDNTDEGRFLRIKNGRLRWEPIDLDNWEGKTIVCFGDSNTEFAGDDGKTYPDHIADMTKATVINVGIGGTRFAQRTTPVVSPSNSMTGYAALDICNIVNAACNVENYRTIVSNGAQWVKDNASDNNIAIINRLLGIDWSNVDAVTFLAATNDFKAGIPLDNESDNYDVNTTLGAIRYIIRLLSTTYPNIKIFFFDVLVRWGILEGQTQWGDDNLWGDNWIVNGVTLKQFAEKVYKAAEECHIPVCSVYNSLGVNRWNFGNYFPAADGTHLNAKGKKLLATKMVSFINANKTF